MDRRRVRRTSPSSVACIRFELGLGGIVLNASEEGLAFQAAGGNPPMGQLTLWISPNPDSQIELTANIKWLDKSNKMGGLKFTQISPDMYRRLQAWLAAEPALGFSSRLDSTANIANGSGPKATSESQSTAAKQSLSTTSLSPAAANIDIQTRPWFSSPYTLLAPRTGSHSHATEDLRRAHIFRVEKNSRLVAAVLILVCIAAPILCLGHWRPQIANFLIQFGESLKAGDASIHDSEPTVAEPFKVTLPDHVGPSPQSRPSPNVSATAPSARPQSPSRAIEEARSTPGRSSQVAALWSAVGRGSPLAEIALAQLYATGHGVRKNCEQARVLLQAASQRGSKDARPLLRNLQRAGCRR